MIVQTPQDLAEMEAMLRDLASGEVEVREIMAAARLVEAEKERVRIAALPRYRCDDCAHECRYDEMDKDYWWNEHAEGWSNWICPNCQVWHDGLRPGEGWTELPK